VNTTIKSDTVWFTTKGQVVIPARLRKQFHIENGTRAIVYRDGGRHPAEAGDAPMRSTGLHGILKRKPGAKPLAGRMGGSQSAKEREREEAKDARHGSR